MTTALPAATTAVASGATQGDVKNWITGVHDYLAGLLGTTGVTADALTALGVDSGSKANVGGSNASGTWPINVTGNASTASTASWLTVDNYGGDGSSGFHIDGYIFNGTGLVHFRASTNCNCNCDCTCSGG